MTFPNKSAILFGKLAEGLNSSDGWLSREQLETLESNGTKWVKWFYPKQFSRDFTFYQNDFWEYGVQLGNLRIENKSAKIQPNVQCHPRGVGKSTNLRALIVYLLARKVKFYVLYVSATQAQAKKHFAALKKMLENPELLKHYPHLRPKKSVHRNMISNWSADRLVTEEGQVIEFVSILGNARGFNTEEGLRLDFIGIDDIDDQKDSVDMTEKKIDILGSNILGAGDDTTDIIFAQNLIHRTSFCTRLRDNNAGILINRKFVGAYPLCKSYEYEEVAVEGDNTGAKQYRVVGFQPFDPATSREYVEILLNRLGVKRFERECQQNLEMVDDDKDFREYSEKYHVITYSEFVNYWKEKGVNVWSKELNRPIIPHNWNVGLGLDWGTTVGHPTCIFPMARPNAAVPLSDSFFTFGEVCLPKFPNDANAIPEIVSPKRVVEAEKAHLKKWNVADRQIVLRRMSHEASAALNAFALDLEEDLKTFYGKWKAQKGSGVPQWQNVMEIDWSKPHPFRKYPKNHRLAGQAIMGCPKWFMVVPDAQGEIRCEVDSEHLFVAQPFNADGCARLRAEIPVYSHRNTGKAKTFDDGVDSGRGLMGEFVLMPQPQTRQEQIESRLPETLKAEEVSQHYGQEGFGELVAARIREQKNISEEIDNEAKQFQENLDRKFSRKSGLGPLGRRRR